MASESGQSVRLINRRLVAHPVVCAVLVCIDDGIADGIAQAAVLVAFVLAQHAILVRAQTLDGGLRAQVGVAGMQVHRAHAQGFEGVAQQQALAGGVDVAALHAGAVPGAAPIASVGTLLSMS